jgi:hypothetical protein
MGRTFLLTKRNGGQLARMTIAATMMFGIASPALVQAQTLQGVWGVITQPVNCTTNTPFGPPERGLVTYHEGGTFTESSGGLAFAPGQRSNGHGSWAATGGLTYTGRLVAMILFETPPNTPPGSPGFQAGWLVATHRVTLSGPDSFTATATVQFVDPTRNVYRHVCATRVGERFK